jgi:hypothetical protein
VQSCTWVSSGLELRVICDFVIATRRRGAGYGPLAIAAIALALATLPAASHAGSVAAQSVRFGQAVTMSARVVKGTVKGRSAAKIDGGTFRYVEIAADAALKGPPAKPGERVLVFDGGPWFQHTHAAAIKAGVVSYADAHYASPVPDAEIKPGAAVIVFLRGEAPPPGFPAGAAFLCCGGGFERPERAADVARMKTAAFGDPITLTMREVAVLPDGLELEVKGHTHKRPIAGGPQKEMAEVQATIGMHSELVILGHTVEQAPPPQPAKETWQHRQWQQYQLILVGLKQGADTTLRVLRKNP